MTASMRNLIWIAALIGFWSLALDWRDQSEKLRPEMERLERLKSREQSAIASVDWEKVSQDALAAQIAWLDRLPEVTQPGVFRAEAMESLADLCKQIQAPCQVAAMGETATGTTGNDRLSTNQATDTTRTAANGTTLANSQRGASGTRDTRGLITSSVKISTSLGPQLMPLLTALEEGPVLRKIDRFTVRSGRAEIMVKVYGLDSGVAMALRTAAKGQASSTPQSGR